MHVADFADVVVSRGDLEFVGVEHRAGLVQRPREVVAVIVHRVVGVLRSVEAAALAVAQPFVHPANDVSRHRRKERNARRLVGVHVVLQQLGVVVRHLLEVRHHPALVDRVAMESSGKLVVDSAARHLSERRNDDVAHVRIARSRIAVQQQIDRRRMRKFRRAAEAAMLRDRTCSAREPMM